MTQEIAIEQIKKMPHEFKIDELMERLLIIEKIDEAEKDIAEGRVISHSEMKKSIEEWKR